jgi:SEC-C motif domain protein
MKFKFKEEDFSNPGLLVFYDDVTQTTDLLDFEVEGKSYFMYESYCKNMSCSCTNAHLFFQESSMNHEIIFTFDYEKKKIVDTQTGVPDTLREQIESDDDLHELFSVKHKLIKAAFESEKNKRKINILKSVAQNLALKGAKIGRNEPCFCGSGSKYKNCCGK